MRGARRCSSMRCSVRGIIPADAGSTITPISQKQHQRDHPRGCGEHGVVASICSPISGSSPRMRGALDRVLKQGMPIRIIPADAGSTTTFYSACGFSQDHPRGCGEHACPLPVTLGVLGSSPRMRGALSVLTRYGLLTGIIPADAGSTLSCRLFLVRRRDHPRGCGEHTGY